MFIVFEELFKEVLLDVKGRTLNNLRYVDAIVLRTDSLECPQLLVDKLLYFYSKYGMKMNTKKPKVMVFCKNAGRIIKAGRNILETERKKLTKALKVLLII